MRSLETCTHVIPMPKSQTCPTIPHELKFFEPELFPTSQSGDENVAISDMQKLKGNVMKM